MDSGIQTGSFNTLLVIPSAITVIIIIGLMGVTKWRSLLWDNKLTISLIISLLALNILEIVTFGNIYQNYNVLLRIYYCVMFVSASLILCLSERLNSIVFIPRKYIYTFCFLISFVSIDFILTSNLIIKGVEIRSHSISRVPGTFYWVFQVYTLICVLAGPALIYRSIFTSKTSLDKKRRIVILISFIPIIFTVLLVIFLMQVGININWSLFLPISTLIFVIVYLFTDDKKDLFRFLVTIPFTNERKAHKELNAHILEYISKTQLDEPIPLKNVLSEIEKIFITNALEIKDGNHNLAAELLSISISTVYRNKERETKIHDT